eukprot:m.240281 g.240281  ORF g.240281 m.240281 type:complete len:1542 (+) comp16076_c0_seq7:1477-6102(+)
MMMDGVYQCLPFVIFALGTIMPIACIGYPWGAPDDSNTCSNTVVIPSSHGEHAFGLPPFTVELLTEYTDVVVNSWEPGKNYDIRVTADNFIETALGGYIIRDKTQIGSFQSLYPNTAAHDAGGASTRAPLEQLRCAGSAVTHKAAVGNTTVNRQTSIRFAVRAPKSALSSWEFSLVILTMPFRDRASFYSSWPLHGNKTLQAGGRMFQFVKAFPLFHPPDASNIVCEQLVSASLLACLRPHTAFSHCLTPAQPNFCSVPDSDVLLEKPSGNTTSVLVGARNILAEVNLKLTALKAHLEEFMGHVRILEPIFKSKKFLLCGTGEGQPTCSFRNLSSFRKPPTWFASGAVARSSMASYGYLVVNNSLYTAHHQDARSLRTDSANIISLSKIEDTSSWTYNYTEKNENGLYRSTNTDGKWLSQPSSNNKVKTVFTKPWTKPHLDEFVYFGLWEYDTESKTQQARVARVCRNEDTPPEKNHFSSFLKIDVACKGGIYSFDATQLTSSATVAQSIGESDPGNSVFYLAFRTPDISTGAKGAVICAFTYETQPGGVDYEMGGKIDAKLNVYSFFNPVSGKKFSCNRTAEDARVLTYVNPNEQEAGYTGKLESEDIALEIPGADKWISHMSIQAFKTENATFQLLWVLELDGSLHKLSALNQAFTHIFTITSPMENPTSMLILSSTSAVILGNKRGITRLPGSFCSKFLTCRTCLSDNNADPECVFSVVQSQCINIAEVEANNEMLVMGEQHQCKPPPRSPEVLNMSSSATSITITFVVRDDNITQHYEVMVNNERMPANLTAKGDKIVAVVKNLLSNMIYSVTVRQITLGGAADSRISLVRTKRAPPPKLPPLTVQARSGTSILISWMRIPDTDHSRFAYYVFRNGTQVYSTESNTTTTSSTTIAKVEADFDCNYIEANAEVFLDSDLSPDTFYFYTVQVAQLNESIDQFPRLGELSDASFIKTLEAPSGLVSELKAEKILQRSMQITWSPPRVLNGRILRYSLTYACKRENCDLLEIQSNHSARNMTLRQLTPATVYEISLAACTGAGCGPTIAIRVSTEPELLDPVHGVKADTLLGTESTEIYLFWEPPTNLAAAGGIVDWYQVVRETITYTDSKDSGSGLETRVATNITHRLYNTTTNFLQDKYRIQACHTYVYKISAVANNLFSSETHISVVAKVIRPLLWTSPPPNVSRLSNGNILVSWDGHAAYSANCDIQKYTIMHRITNSSDTKLFGKWNELCCGTGDLRTSLVVTDDLRSGHQFTLQEHSVDSFGLSRSSFLSGVVSLNASLKEGCKTDNMTPTEIPSLSTNIASIVSTTNTTNSFMQSTKQSDTTTKKLEFSTTTTSFDLFSLLTSRTSTSMTTTTATKPSTAKKDESTKPQSDIAASCTRNECRMSTFIAILFGVFSGILLLILLLVSHRKRNEGNGNEKQSEDSKSTLHLEPTAVPIPRRDTAWSRPQRPQRHTFAGVQNSEDADSYLMVDGLDSSHEERAATPNRESLQIRDSLLDDEGVVSRKMNAVLRDHASRNLLSETSFGSPALVVRDIC